MFFIYQILTYIILLISPIIILFRLIKKKESKSRFIEKFTIFSKQRKKGTLIWFHVASVGELISIIPLVRKFESENKIKTILITSSTLSSSYIFTKFKFKKTIHQFFPLDLKYFASRFINYWKPSICIFIDSEIWPNMFYKIKSKSIPLVLMNARITERSFKRWNIFKNFATKVFNKIDFAFPQNQETINYLKKFKVKKIKNLGNLKFAKQNKIDQSFFSKKFYNQFRKRVVFTAVSTHPSEEIIIGRMHQLLKISIPNLITIIIPRHIERITEIKDQLEALKLSVDIKSTNKIINTDTDILLVDSYGETKKFFPITNLVFMGGSLIEHGGQNPIEPATFNLNILHGPHIKNFKEVYKFFGIKKISFQIKKVSDLVKKSKILLKKRRSKKINIDKLGERTLNLAFFEIKKIINFHENKKTKILGQ